MSFWKTITRKEDPRVYDRQIARNNLNEFNDVN